MTEAALSVKPPPFYPKYPETWFKQLESQFILSKITNTSTKYHIALSNLPENVAANVIGDDANYENLKKSILDSLKQNKHNLIEQALAKMSLGDKRPTQLVAEIQRNFSDIGLNAEEAIIKNRLMSALPSSIRSALVGHENQSLNEFAKIADSMLAVSSSDSPFTVGTIKSYSARRSGNNLSRDYRFAVRPFKPEQKPRICNAHIFYAERARTCRPWCQWPGTKPKIISRNQKTPAQTRPSSPAKC